MTDQPVNPHELEETFGPQWEAVVALVRRAAVLTIDEVSRLHAARAAAGTAAWDAARDAARDAAGTAAWDATRTAAWDAARDAAWDAARDAAWDAAATASWAARALAIRDLIGQNGFTQKHYDTFTGPWASVIGPAHPDDK